MSLIIPTILGFITLCCLWIIGSIAMRRWYCTSCGAYFSGRPTYSHKKDRLCEKCFLSLKRKEIHHYDGML